MPIHHRVTFLIFLSLISLRLTSQVPYELIEGRVEFANTVELDTSILYVGIADGSVSINGNSICNTQTDQITLFILRLNKETFEIQQCISYKSERTFSISQIDARNNQVIIAGSFNKRIAISETKLESKSESTFLIQLDLITNKLRLVKLSDQFNRITSISISPDNKLVITGTFYKPGFKILGTKVPEFSSEVQSYIILCDRNLQVTHARVLQNSILHDVVRMEDFIVFTGTFYDSASLDNHALLSKGYKLFAGKIDKDNNSEWLISLSGESTCAEMHSSLVYDKIQGHLFITGVYCGQDEFIPLGFYHCFLAKVNITGEVDWFKRINNMPLRLTNPKLKVLNNRAIHLSMNQTDDCSIRGYSVENKENQIIVCEIDSDAILRKINIYKSSYYFPPNKSIQVNEYLDNKEYPDHRMSLAMNSVSSKVENQFISTKGIGSDYFAILTVKGVKGYGHAGLLLLKKRESHLEIITSYALISSNYEMGNLASLGIVETGNNEMDVIRYQKGLKFSAGKIPDLLQPKILNSNSSRYYIEITEDQANKILSFVNNITKNQGELSIHWSNQDINRTNDFYLQIEKNFKDLGEILELNLSSSNEIILPDNLHSMIRSQRWKFDFKQLPGTDFDLAYGKIPEKTTGDGSIKFIYKNGDIVLSNGTAIRYIYYDGIAKDGYPNGEGSMKYITLNDLRFTIDDTLIYTGSFEKGLFKGNGKVYIRDTVILYDGQFEDGKFTKGWMYNYFWSNFKLESKCQYSQGKLNGICQNYFPLLDISGTSSIIEYENGVKNGFSYTFYPLSQKIQSKSKYLEGLEVGKTVFFFYDGVVFNTEENIYTDVRTAISKQIKDNIIEYHYANFDPEGFGNLLFHTTDNVDWYNLSEKTSFKDQIFYERIFKHANGDIHTVKNENSVYQFNNGNILISNYGFRSSLIQESMSMGGTIPSLHHMEIEELYGDYVLYLSDNSRLSGTITNGKIDGSASYLTPKNEIQEVTVSDGQWTWTYKERRYSSNFFKKGLQKLTKGVLGVIDEIGEGICKLFGKDPEKGEQCGGGIEVDSEGNVRLLDPDGNPVPTDPNPGDDIHIYTTAEFTEFDNQLIFDGTIKFIEESKITANATSVYGSPWPGMAFGEAVFPPNGTGQIRKDPMGDGDFLSSRTSNGVKRFHKGIDYSIDVDQLVIAPVSGKVIRISNAYKSNNNGLKAIVISNDGYTAKVLYVNPSYDIKTGSQVVAGETILGRGQNLKVKHGPNISNHIHVELYDRKGKIIPPNGKYPLLNN